MAETLRSDGKAVDVLVDREVEKGDPGYFEGFKGIVMDNAESGEKVALEIALREHEIVVGSGITAAKGDILYIHEDGTVDATAADGVEFMKVTLAKDSNNVVWGVLLPQGEPIDSE